MSFRDCCGACNDHRHCNGGGTFELFDQDGLNRYLCQCYCARSARQRRREDEEIADVIRKYGAERVRAALP